MGTQEIDISWQVLRQIVHDWAGSSADLSEVTPLAGGSIDTALALTCNDGLRAVLKVTPHRIDRAHADQACQLNLLRQLDIPAPEVYRCEIGTLDRPFSFVLMEYVDGVDLETAKKTCDAAAYDALQEHLAELCLRMHAHTATQYGRVSSQPAKAFDEWAECFREIYDPICPDVEKSGALSPKQRKLVHKLHERLPRYLAHDDGPRLVHWDLWSSNLLAKQGPEGKWRVVAMLDPNCKYAHAEAEIAYLELFHTVNGAFLRAYQSAQRLPNDYHRVRKPIYHLYSMLDHLHLFGHEYLKPTLAALERVAPLV